MMSNAEKQASMGPPQNSGGEPTRWESVLDDLSLLQWGRRRTAAERTLVCMEKHFLLQLQWGRRRTAAESCSRTTSRRLEWTRFNGAAAEQRRRGSRRTSRTLGPPSCFNGAAAEQRRRGRRRRRRRRRGMSFNGAAAEQRRRGLRELHEGGRVLASMGPPQNSGGEAADRSARNDRPRASMGPPQNSGGEELAAAERRRSLSASMGPPQNSGGETRPWHGARAVHTCFNGAAAEQRRRARLQIRENEVNHRLQWGRRRTAAESGMRTTQCWCACTLQWGRRRTAAERDLGAHMQERGLGNGFASGVSIGCERPLIDFTPPNRELE